MGPLFQADVVSPRGGPGMLHRSGRLSPYVAEELVQDVLRAGAGARVELTIDDAEGELAGLCRALAPPVRRHIEVRVRRAGAGELRLSA